MSHAERSGLLRAARECDEGAVGPGVLFEWDGCLHALGDNGVAALKFMAEQFREGAAGTETPEAEAAPLSDVGRHAEWRRALEYVNEVLEVMGHDSLNIPMAMATIRAKARQSPP